MGPSLPVNCYIDNQFHTIDSQYGMAVLDSRVRTVLVNIGYRDVPVVVVNI